MSVRQSRFVVFFWSNGCGSLPKRLTQIQIIDPRAKSPSKNVERCFRGEPDTSDVAAWVDWVAVVDPEVACVIDAGPIVNCANVLEMAVEVALERVSEGRLVERVESEDELDVCACEVE